MTTMLPGTNEEDSPQPPACLMLQRRGSSGTFLQVAWFFESICQASSIPPRIPRCDRQVTSFAGHDKFHFKEFSVYFQVDWLLLRAQSTSGFNCFSSTASLSTLSNHRTTQTSVTKAGRELESPLKEKHILAAF